MPQPVSELPPRKQDAIHRALLSGLVGNVGVRAEGVEYQGVRGKKFHLFPGSTLFRQRPPWVMSAELVETTKLYARTNAGVHPMWVERAAAHLVKRTYSDPHWRPDIGRVLAYEKVTLHGLTLVPRRKVHYGPLDPKLCREILIHHALVLGEYQSDAAFFRHNRELVRQVQAIEAKARRRDVLVEPKARFSFYDARIPRRVYTADEFEKWRRAAEKHNPKLLFMSRHDLMLHPALGVTEELYPDSIVANGMTFALQYRFEPGDRADGITATVPLAALNQLSPEPFDWLVPGFRTETFVSLIRTLAKGLRVKFVPVPQFATRAAQELKPSDGTVTEALARFLGRESGEPVGADDFRPEGLPEHLRMNFQIVDGAGEEVAMGRDLAMIRRQLGLQARASFADHPPPEFHRDGISRWDFGDLPERVEVHHGGMTLNGYPALVDAGKAVNLRLFDSRDAADEAMRGGLRKLFMIQLRREFDHIEQMLPDMERLCLYYATIGRCEDLRHNLLQAIADRAFFGDEPWADLRSRERFADRAEAGWRRLSSAASDVTGLVAQSLDAYHTLDIALSNDFPPLWHESIRDLRDQLRHLVFRGFVGQTPYPWLREIPRYLRGMDIRMKKLGNAGLNRDTQALAEVVPLWDAYKHHAARDREQGIADPALQQYRWMIEELRISLFAQELKASMPVSAQRLQKQWELVRK